MQVSVDQIREAGLQYSEPIPLELLQEALGGEHDTGYRALGAGKLNATFQKVSGGVLLDGHFQADVLCLCKRCLAEVKLSVPVDFTLNLVPKGQLAAQGEGEDKEGEDDEGGEQAGSFDLEDANREVFDGKTIELDPIVREQVLLALPMHAVCRDDCKGLCGMCGQNLNEGSCGCDRRQIDPRLAALKDIKLS